MINFKSYSTKSDAVRSFKKIHGLDLNPMDFIVNVEGRFNFPLEIAMTEVAFTLAQIVPAELLATVSAKNTSSTIVNLHPAETFPGRERNIGLWVELDNGRGVAIATNKKTGDQKVIVVKVV